MNIKDDGGAAFPGFSHTEGHGPMRQGPNGWETFQPGITIRDYFAAQAMQAWVSKSAFSDDAEKMLKKVGIKPAQAEAFLAMLSYSMADAMLTERAKTNGAE